jgi:hypothetical protein
VLFTALGSNFLREAQIWYDRNPAESARAALFENVIVLSDEFYSEICSCGWRIAVSLLPF